jgi:hypothetical protein
VNWRKSEALICVPWEVGGPVCAQCDSRVILGGSFCVLGNGRTMDTKTDYTNKTAWQKYSEANLKH